jgi:tetratricopeptide (TPR) repeat protein
VDALVDQVRLWESRSRDPELRAALAKLRHAEPEHPVLLELTAAEEIAAGRVAEAQWTIRRLRQVAPEHPRLRQLERVLRLDDADRERLANVRVLALGGHTRQAVAILEDLFPDGFPNVRTELSYWELLASLEGTFARAKTGLEALRRAHPGHQGVRLAELRHLAGQGPIDVALLEELRALAQDPHIERQAAHAWQKALRNLDDVPASLAHLDRYLQLYPGDNHVRQKRARVRARSELLQNPLWREGQRGLLLAEAGDLEAAESKLRAALRRYPQDPEFVGGLGLVLMRSGRRDAAIDQFQKALRHDPDNRGKWRSLITTARFWATLAEVESAVGAGHFDQAERLLGAAARLEPKNLALWRARAALAAARGQPEVAMALYEQALARSPNDGDTLRGWLEGFVTRGDRDRLEGALAALSPPQRQALGDVIPRLRADLLRDDARVLTGQGRFGAARETLEQALAQDGRDPWIRFDLARAHLALGERGRGDALLEGVGDAETRFAYALYLSGQERIAEARAVLSEIPASDRSPGAQSLWQRLQVAGHLEAGDLAAAAATAGAREDLLREVARALAARGEKARAAGILAACVEPASRLDLAGYTQNTEILRQLAHETLGLDEQLQLLDMAERLDVDLALRVVDALLAERPDSLEVLTRYARIVPREAEKVATYRRILELYPQAWEARIAVAALAHNEGQTDAAEFHLWAVLEEADLPLGPTWTALELLRDMGRLARGSRYVQGSAARFPLHAGILELKANLSGQLDDYAAALSAERLELEMAGGRDLSGESVAAARQIVMRQGGTALDLDPRPVEEVFADARGQDHWRISRMLAEGRRIRQRENVEVWGAVEVTTRSATPGVSSLTAVTVPMYAALPVSVGRVWGRAEAVTLNAGVLNPSAGYAYERYGRLSLCADCSASYTAGARGLGLAMGLDMDAWRVDMGVTPLGFAQATLVGGAEVDGRVGPISVTAALSQRPFTSSILTFAGATDPVSGQTWGAVRALGTDVTLSLDDGGPLGAWAVLGAHLVHGTKVADNYRLRAMGGGYLRVSQRDPARLDAGLNLMGWHFGRDLSEFTFGQGGYYSPQGYGSIGLPLQLYGRLTPALTYGVRAALSYSWSRDEDAPYFPLEPSSAGGATFAGGQSAGLGYALRAALEWQASHHWTLGATATLERADFYAPNGVTLYLRHTLLPGLGPPAVPPTPLPGR